MSDLVERRILLCMPFGRDAELASNVLENAGLDCFVCTSLTELVREVYKGAAAILTVEEALPEGPSKPLSAYFFTQPTWSDLPILVLTKPGGESPWIKGAYERLGNLTLLERPVRTSTLISAARSALRARLRQYEVRIADQRKDEFLAMLAHELRNPLAPISAAANLLELVSSQPERVLQTSEIIARQVGHMTTLIDDLLDMARVTRGLITLQKEMLDVRDILAEAVEQVSPLITHRKHHLALHLSPDPAPVVGDRKRLVQVIANVLGNASKYTQEGGNIVVRLQIHPEEITLDVSDDGIGMAPEMVSRVFELFAQAERTPDRSQGGLGLGLALVKNLVTSHGGKVGAYSEGPGKGSTFTVRLPRMPIQWEVANARDATRQLVRHSTQPLRILVVDDNKDAANTLEMFLGATGHTVSVEYIAADAIERARATLPHVCLLDLGLPDIDGHELARRLRAMPETCTAVLIAVTGYSHERDKEKSIAAGFDHHLVKPLDTAKLARLLSSIVSSSPHSIQSTEAT
ncbi:hybrid sensor histidine kinase/response regulator [Noviherbaspirillum sp. Root189]|uniref:hybrid sensor histidine kinase/response regulator n=1 Tax=Noviherbaspirillum sp. Root189 TaxID=1736487 RepID=UPI0007109965|nr:ATP-binding protein [Noviherbaspirillum sp. Root189]KRB83869.1 histidine kinase [Noviherbaspirillum sp. Root189]